MPTVVTSWCDIKLKRCDNVEELTDQAEENEVGGQTQVRIILRARGANM